MESDRHQTEVLEKRLRVAAELVVSELVTNALRHGLPSAGSLAIEHCVRLRLLAQSPFVMCMVADPGRGIPMLRESGPASESGRGLTVVEACCERWGWHLWQRPPPADLLSI